MQKTYANNDHPRHEPKDLQRNDLAPPGMAGTAPQPRQTPKAVEREDQAARLAEQLKAKREQRSIENKQGIHGQRQGPFVAKRHFERAR